MTKRARHHPELPAIYTFRGARVVIDADLAALYGVAAKHLNQAVRRNRERFPADFLFRLTGEEVAALRSQIATLDENDEGEVGVKWAALKTDGRGKHRKYLPWVFTEHGALMAANVLRSERAIEMSVYLVRAFVQMRETILAHAGVLKRLAEIDGRLIEHDSVLREIVERLQPLLDAPPADDAEKPKIGFHRGNR